MKACYSCGAEWTDREDPGFSAVCERCGEYLHCCRNCRFHSPGYHNDCREPGAEMVRDKAGRNLCDWFQFAEGGTGGRAGSGDDRAARSRAKLESLFKPPAGSESESGKETR